MWNVVRGKEAIVRLFRLIVLSLSVILLALATASGILMNYLFVFLVVSAAAMMVTIIVSFARRHVQWRSSESTAGLSAYVLRALLRNAAWFTIGVCIYIAVVPIQFPADVFSAIAALIWGSVVLLCLLEWIPRKKKSRALTVTLSIFLVVLAVQLIMIYLPTQSSSSLVLAPLFKGDWYVLNGGNSVLINHHHFAGSQKYALDILLPEDCVLPVKQVTELRDYSSFGESLYSPVDGNVIAAENSLPDLEVGKMDRKNLAGNHIVIKTDNDLFLLMAHLQKNSVLVSIGERVRTGQKLAKIGNSGNTTQPHLHLHAMTGANFMDPSSKPVPISFKVNDQEPQILKRNDILLGL